MSDSEESFLKNISSWCGHLGDARFSNSLAYCAFSKWLYQRARLVLAITEEKRRRAIMKASQTVLIENAAALVLFVLNSGKNFDNTRFAECLKRSFPETDMSELKAAVKLGRINAVAERTADYKARKGLGVIETTPEKAEIIRHNVEEWQRRRAGETVSMIKEPQTEGFQEEPLPSLPPITMMSVISYKPQASPEAMRRAKVATQGGVGNNVRTGKTARKHGNRRAA